METMKDDENININHNTNSHIQQHVDSLDTSRNAHMSGVSLCQACFCTRKAVWSAVRIGLVEWHEWVVSDSIKANMNVLGFFPDHSETSMRLNLDRDMSHDGPRLCFHHTSEKDLGSQGETERRLDGWISNIWVQLSLCAAIHGLKSDDPTKGACSAFKGIASDDQI